MANPTLNQSIFQKLRTESYSESMTIKGTMAKSLLLLVIIMLAGGYTWKMFYGAANPNATMPYLWGGLIVGFILAMIIIFKPKTAPYLSPIYAAAEGLSLGVVSAIYNFSINPEGTSSQMGIVLPAVAITLTCAFLMFILYNTRIIKVNNKFRKIIHLALISILVFYAGTAIASLFGANVSLLVGNSPLSIGISVVICAVAAFSLLTDYDMIEQGAMYGAPKYMEWYGAFALMVTLVWLYLEILKLLAKISARER
ncbi:MAG: Bax inhibitor-1/YccA family protein [Bacteroidales bacterium]|nr:Bax inhibitor-1/YccA family protein [Bacteroidales bacterium]